MAQAKLLEYRYRAVSDILLERKLITANQLPVINQLRSEYKDKIGKILLNEGVIRSRDLYSVLAEHFNTEYVDLKRFPCDKELLLKEEVDRYIEFNFVPWKKVNDVVYVATIGSTDKLSLHLKKQYKDKFKVVIATPEDIMRVIQNNFSSDLLDSVKSELINVHPHYSAYKLLLLSQKVIIYVTLTTLLLFLCTLTSVFLKVFLLTANIIYFLNTASKVYFFASGMNREEDEILYPQMAKSSLPIYTILLPLYKEDDSIKTLLNSIKNLNYPKSKLDVIIVVEQFDRQTISSLKNYNKDDFFRIVCVPKSYPKTKPKACSYALKFARGRYLTIYDAEDQPDPDQLLKAVHVFNNSPDDVMCLQSKLNYRNRTDNLLSSLFSIEYSIWFDFFLKGLERANIPIPLGGTSNHFKLKELKKMMGWDPYNVAEDAEIGYRLAKNGYRTLVLDSRTMEESPIKLKTWLLQRTRWIKGHIQTYVVHLRTLSYFRRSYNLKGILGFHSFLIFPIISYFSQLAFMPVMFFDMNDRVFLYIKMISIVNLALWILLSLGFGIFVVIKNKWERMSVSVIVYPFYYLLHSVAFFMAFYQLLFKPHYWNKTLRDFNKNNVNKV